MAGPAVDREVVRLVFVTEDGESQGVFPDGYAEFADYATSQIPINEDTLARSRTSIVVANPQQFVAFDDVGQSTELASLILHLDYDVERHSLPLRFHRYGVEGKEPYFTTMSTEVKLSDEAFDGTVMFIKGGDGVRARAVDRRFRDAK